MEAFHSTNKANRRWDSITSLSQFLCVLQSSQALRSLAQAAPGRFAKLVLPRYAITQSEWRSFEERNFIL